MATPGKYNMVVYQGASFRKRFVWRGRNKRPIDLTGYSARMCVRLRHSDEVIKIDLSTQNGKIVLFPTQGAFELVLTREEILELDFARGVYVLVFFAPDGVTAIRRIEGTFTVSPGATR